MKEYKIKINGSDYNVTVKNVESESAEVSVNGTEYSVAIEGLRARPQTKTPKLVRPAVVTTGESHPAAQKTNTPASAASVAAGDVKSPLPGVVLDVMVREGDTVKTGQRLLLLEAMKMENNIEADRDGVVRSIKVRTGDSVLEGDVLVTIG
ncbi:MAG: biotin/lipoyl-containing protein [Rikenellaceae bacterium]